MWESCGKHVGIMWESCGNHVGIMWESCGNQVGIMWESCDCRTEPAAEPWVGLVHDGSQDANETSFRWLDAGRVTFLAWSPAEPNELGGVARCSRIKLDRFATKSCDFFGFSTLCQPRGED